MSGIDEVRAIVARTRAEQGLPPKITDGVTLGKVAGLMRLDEAVVETLDHLLHLHDAAKVT